MTFLKSLALNGFLSFPPDAPAIELSPLNVLIGANGSGKSNLIRALEVIRATPTALATLVREGGTAQEWIWKGTPVADQARIEVELEGQLDTSELRYRMAFASAGQRMEIVEELFEGTSSSKSATQEDLSYYEFRGGNPTLRIRDSSGIAVKRKLKREDLVVDESILSQRKDPDLYPELTWLGQQFAKIQVFRDWTFGRFAPMRWAQFVDGPADFLTAGSSNLGLILNELQLTDSWIEFNHLLNRFLPRFERFSTRILGNTVQVYLHEAGLRSPIPATHLSDGTLRFMAILAQLLSPTHPPLLCIEEPELGLHPDAVSLLAEVLVEASARMQLIITTHSDALVSSLTDHASSVLVCEHRNGTHVERVDPDKLGQWLDEYRLGDIWRIGQLGGNP